MKTLMKIALTTGLLAVTALVLNWRINKQFENEARHTLANADEGFTEWHNQRNLNWIVRSGDPVHGVRLSGSYLPFSTPSGIFRYVAR